MTAKQSEAVRREQILNAALTLSATKGYPNITRDAVAVAAGLSAGTVNKYFSTMPQVKHAVMRYAVNLASRPKSLTVGVVDNRQRELALQVVAQGLALNDKQALKAGDEVKKAARAALA